MIMQYCDTLVNYTLEEINILSPAAFAFLIHGNKTYYVHLLRTKSEQGIELSFLIGSKGCARGKECGS